MLFYHGSGERRYDRQPHPVRRRAHWEFAAVLSGRAAPLLADARRLDPTPALWIFPPRHAHGWTAPAGQACRICTVHLASCPPLLVEAIGPEGYLHLRLSPPERRRLRQLDDELAQLATTHPQASEIAAELARGTFASLAVRRLPSRPRGGASDAARLVKELLMRVEEDLHTGLRVEDLTRMAGCSPAQLRRLCHRATGHSPRWLLEDCRLQRARRLLAEEAAGLEAVATACGYASAVALSQAFLRRYGLRPGAYRRRAGQK